MKVTRDELIARIEARKRRCEEEIIRCNEQIEFLKKDMEEKKDRHD